MKTTDTEPFTVKFGSDGLIPAIVQDYLTKDVLMHAYMNAEALQKTIDTGKAHYYSRSRQKLWLKGETSGNYQHVRGILKDCDDDTLLLIVEQTGNACHTGNRTCFFRKQDGSPIDGSLFEEDCGVLSEIYSIVTDRRDNPQEGSYTNYLFDKGIDKILKKVGEETAEVLIAAKNNDKSEISYEVSDLMYHLTVMMADRGVKWEDIYDELRKRR